IWEPALETIQKQLPDVKLIVLLREPVDRTISHYRWMYAGGLEKRDFRTALRADKRDSFDPRADLKGCFPCYLRSSQYSRFCPFMFNLFGRARVLLLRTQDLATDRASALQAAFRFLGVRETDVRDEVRANTTDAISVQRTLGLDVLLRAMPKQVRDTFS